MNDFYYAQKVELKESSAVSSSSAEEFFAGNTPLEPEEFGTDDLRIVERKINKKRSIEITVETDSVSVRLFDNSAEDEIISAFWVEGIYESSEIDGDYYVVNLFKNVSEEELLEDMYLPMVGDPVNGTYMIPEESIFVPEKITKGIISIAVKIDISTGEYYIYASLV